jgi:hypothetical protein
VKADSDSGNEHTHSKYQTAAKNIELWAHSNHLVRLSQITPDALDHWKSLWSPKAKNPNDRIGKTTAGRRLEKVKRFFNYCVKMHWLAANPAAELKANKPDPSVTWPLLSGRYEKVIAATYEYDKRARRPSDQFGADMRAIIELMRWTGSNAVREYDPRVGEWAKTAIPEYGKHGSCTASSRPSHAQWKSLRDCHWPNNWMLSFLDCFAWLLLFFPYLFLLGSSPGLM